jgi:hypothetical protein
MKIKAEDEMQRALLKALGWISTQDIANYFKHCGYELI